MKVDELRKKTSTELKDHLVELKREILNLRFQRVSGQLESTARFRSARREVARIKTILAETTSGSSSEQQGVKNAT